MYDVKIGGVFFATIYFLYIHIFVVVVCGIHYLYCICFRCICFVYIFAILNMYLLFVFVEVCSMHTYICIYMVYDDGRYDMIFSLMIGNDSVC